MVQRIVSLIVAVVEKQAIQAKQGLEYRAAEILGLAGVLRFNFDNLSNGLSSRCASESFGSVQSVGIMLLRLQFRVSKSYLILHILTTDLESLTLTCAPFTTFNHGGSLV